MFLGSSVHNLDDKGRLTLPNKDRQSFTDSKVYATMGFDGSIDLYPEKEFSVKKGQIQGLNDFDKDNRQLKRMFFSCSAELLIDSHGRIQLPKPLLLRAGITKSVTFVGQDTYMELWDSEKFDSLEKKGEENYQCLAQKVFDGTH